MNWLLNNKEWIFSGTGVAILGFIFSFIFRKIKQRSQGKINENINSIENTKALQRTIIYKNRKDPNRISNLNKNINSATNIIACGLGLYELTTDINVEFYKDFLIRREGELKILFLNPNGEEIKKRNTTEGRNKNTLKHIVESNIQDLSNMLSECYNENPNALNKLEICFYDRPLRLNCIIIDKKTAFVQHYGEKSRGVAAPSLEIHKTNKNTIFNWYHDELKFLYERHSQKIDSLELIEHNKTLAVDKKFSS